MRITILCHKLFNYICMYMYKKEKLNIMLRLIRLLDIVFYFVHYM